MTTEKVGFSIREWCDATGIGRTKTYELLQDQKILSVKIGTRTIISTSPREFLAAMVRGPHD